jgi:DNA-binding transcriptional ArsR family regulator
MADPAKKNLTAALNHPLRRVVLRRLNASKDPLSPARLAERLCASLSDVSYHVTVLRKCGVVEIVKEQQVRGAIEHLFVSKVVDNQAVQAMLAETEAEDESAYQG